MINPVERKLNRQNLILANKALKRFKPFPFFGTLLGLVREGDIIKGDDDVDLYVDRRHRSGVIDGLSSFGFSLFTDTEFFLQFNRKIGEVDTFVDVYLYINDYRDSFLVEKWNFFALPDDSSRHLHVDKSIIFPLKKKKIFGEKFLLPNRPKKCCELLYGKTWRRSSSKFQGQYKIALHNNSPVLARQGELVFRLISENKILDDECFTLRSNISELTRKVEFLTQARVDLLAKQARNAADFRALTLERNDLKNQLQKIGEQGEEFCSRREDVSAEQEELVYDTKVNADCITKDDIDLSGECDEIVASSDWNVDDLHSFYRENCVLTSAIPEGFRWEILSFPSDALLQLHSHQSHPTSAVVIGGVPEGTFAIVAKVRIASWEAFPTEFAMRVVTPSSMGDTSSIPAESDWTLFPEAGWHLVAPDVDVVLRVDLPAATTATGDLHVAIRLPEESSYAFGWCRWLSVTCLQVGSRNL